MTPSGAAKQQNVPFPGSPERTLGRHPGELEYLPAQQGHDGFGFGVPRDLEWQGLQASRASGW